jgi:hypothetical protein
MFCVISHLACPTDTKIVLAFESDSTVSEFNVFLWSDEIFNHTVTQSYETHCYIHVGRVLYSPNRKCMTIGVFQLEIVRLGLLSFTASNTIY